MDGKMELTDELKFNLPFWRSSRIVGDCDPLLLTFPLVRLGQGIKNMKALASAMGTFQNSVGLQNT